MYSKMFQNWPRPPLRTRSGSVAAGTLSWSLQQESALFSHGECSFCDRGGGVGQGQPNDGGARSGSKARRERKGREAGEIQERDGASNLLAYHIQD